MAVNEELEKVLNALPALSSSEIVEVIPRIRDLFAQQQTELLTKWRQETDDHARTVVGSVPRQKVREMRDRINVHGQCKILSVSAGAVEVCHCGKCEVDQLLAELGGEQDGGR